MAAIYGKSIASAALKASNNGLTRSICTSRVSRPEPKRNAITSSAYSYRNYWL